MLVLSRKEGQGISVRNTSTGETIEVFILNRKGKRDLVGIGAPPGFEIRRIDLPKTPAPKTTAAESP